jgi:hypothetical protein
VYLLTKVLELQKEGSATKVCYHVGCFIMTALISFVVDSDTCGSKMQMNAALCFHGDTGYVNKSQYYVYTA